MGSFRIFGSADGGRGANWVRFVNSPGGIGFVSHFWVGEAGETPAVRDWVCFAYLDRGPGWSRGKLGSFRRNRGWRDTWYAEIGFVSYFWVVGGVDWVRFAFLGLPQVRRG